MARPSFSSSDDFTVSFSWALVDTENGIIHPSIFLTLWSNTFVNRNFILEKTKQRTNKLRFNLESISTQQVKTWYLERNYVITWSHPYTEIPNKTNL